MAITLNLKSIMAVGIWTLGLSPKIMLTCVLPHVESPFDYSLLPHNPL